MPVTSSVCIKRHFGANGEPIEVGTIVKREADGVFFEAVKAEPEKKLEVATPAKAKAAK